MSDVEEFLRCAHAMADAARPIPMRYFRNRPKVETKADASPVTIADKETETELIRVLDEHYPDHGLFGEEHGSRNLDNRFVWVLDPIDGTRSFLSGMPFFGTLIALLDDGVPILGIVDIPAMGERYVGTKGQASTFNGNPISACSTQNLNEALLFPAEHGVPSDAVANSFKRAKAAARETRHGYDCYLYAQLAAGHIEAIIETELAPYDYLALVPLIEGAGGCITDWNGKPLGLQSKGDVAASATAELHGELLNLLDPGH